MSNLNGFFPGRFSTVTVTLLFGMLAPGHARGQTSSGELLKERLGFGRFDVMALEGGRIVVKVPKSDDAHEVAVLGAVRVDVPMEFLVDYFGDVEGFFAGHDIVVQVGQFSAVPRRADLERFRLTEKDVKALRECVVGECKVKLSGSEIERVQREVNWSEPDYERQVTDVMTRGLIRSLRSYLSEGNAALPTYHDKREPLSGGEGFRILLAKSRKHLEREGGLFDYMADYPRSKMESVQDVYYWTVEDFGLKPVMSLKHMMIVQRPNGESSHAAIAIKQIYASHYFQSVIKLATLTRASSKYPLRGTYLVLFAHMRFDGRVGGIKRAILQRQLKHTWAMYMKSLRKRAEAKFRKTRVAAR